MADWQDKKEPGSMITYLNLYATYVFHTLVASIQAQFLLDLVGFHGIRQVLLVGEDEDYGVPHLPVIDNAVQLLAGLVDAVAVGAVHYEDQTLCPGVVMPPERPDLVLAAHIPDVELDIFILDSTFPIASEEPGPGAFRCPGSPLPATPPPPRNRNEASQSRGRPCGLRGSRLLGAEARARRSLGHHRPPNSMTPLVSAAGALSLRPESRRPAEARPGPELPFPPAGAARAPLPFPLLCLLLTPPRESAALRPGPRPASTALTTDPGHPRGSAAPAPSQVIDPRGNSMRRLRRHREGEGSYCCSSRGKRRPRGPAFPAQPRRLPPAAAPSAGSLRPPPPPPSSAAAAAGKGAEETASLPLPTTQAQRRPTVRTRATSVRRAARAPSVGAPRAEGRGYGGSEGAQVLPAPTPANIGL
ncbi:uncharacterized protein LOC141578029 [Camelus bactrianus]|uniref:Uncharacterized protein LOC141578029 n=1 Tax=Camelus bactrianus TaxID=9837 RepID=A0AC58QK72_CAMBA